MTAAKANLVLIMCDQMRYNCTGFAGNQAARTPTLDRMACEGLRFENAYCASPICSPARASWLTGLYPHGHGQQLNYNPHDRDRCGGRMRRDVVTLGDALNRAGYRCGLVGPWHLGDDEIPQHGFDAMWQSYGYQDVKTDAYSQYLQRQDMLDAYQADAHQSFFRRLTQGDSPVTVAGIPVEHQRTTWAVNRGIDFIKTQAEPFFLFLSIKDPHPPILPPQELLADFPWQQMPVLQNWHDSLEGKPRSLRENKRRAAQQCGYKGLQKVTAHYLALIAHIDNQLERLFATLQERQFSDNTLVVFFSDHGEMLGEHGLFAKCVMYEGSVRVPMLLRWPGRIPPGSAISAPLAGVDLMPTLLDLLGVRLNDKVHGRSLAGPILEGSEPSPADVFAVIPTLQAIDRRPTDNCPTTEQELTGTVMIRRGCWKYIWHRGDTDELYDLRADPDEMENLARQSDQKHRVEELRARIRERLDKPEARPYAWLLD